MLTPRFFGEVKGTNFKPYDPARFKVHLASLESKQVEVVVQKVRNNRTLSQNRYYFGVVVAILAEEFGYEIEEMHEALKWKFLRKHEDTALVTVGSTAKLSIGEFCDYIDTVTRWAAQEGIYIPQAGEVEI